MADQKDGRTHNQPSHDDQVKGEHYSHGGTRSDRSQPQQGQGNQRQPTMKNRSRAANAQTLEERREVRKGAIPVQAERPLG
jgi:hypothetical protein